MRPPTVLVVDDIVDIVEELVALMGRHGVCAVGASDLTEAVEMLNRELHIKVISCDVRLGCESGPEIIDRIKAHAELQKREFRYLFVTGDEIHLKQLDPTLTLAALSKPVQPSILIDTIKKMLEPVSA